MLPDQTHDQTLERIQLWRHFAQCLLAEDRARQFLATVAEFAGPDSAAARTAQAELDAKGVCFTAAILALDEDLRPGVSAPADALRPLTDAPTEARTPA